MRDVDFYMTGADRVDLCMMPKTATLDLEVGDDDDFELVIPLKDYDPLTHVVGGYIYCPFTEYGGLIANPQSNTAKGTIGFIGQSFRGMLENKIVEPPAGSDYLVLSGDLHDCIRQILGAAFSPLFVCVGSAGVSVGAFQVDRYVTAREAIEKLCKAVGYRLKISVNATQEQFYVALAAVPVVDYSDEEEISQDANLDFVISLSTTPYTHMICAGRGELAEREIVKLAYNGGNITEVGSIPEGLNVRTYFYDNSGAESREELAERGRDKFYEINATDAQEVSVGADADLFEVGDIIGGRDYVTGIVVKEPITRKIVKVKNGITSIQYKLGV